MSNIEVNLLPTYRSSSYTKVTPTLISGFHHALLQLITFISRLNALDYTKLIS